MKYYLAIDIGASSGRHIIGYKENGNLITDEVYRFKNGLKEIDGRLTWDIDSILSNVKEGIKEAIKKYPHIESMSIDTWGVDYVLLNDSETIYPVYAYRDKRTQESIRKVHNLIPFEKLYSLTGSQFQEFNTIYQLYRDKMDGRLDKATDFLHIPEYLIYKLTGIKAHEYTNASTTGMMDAISNDYSKEIIETLGLKKSLFNKLQKPGTKVGNFTDQVQKEVNGNILVKLCPTHDTASAVEGIPMTFNSPYISSGTWSLLGIKLEHTITSLKAMDANYSNEYGPNYIRFQKNIMGLWIIQGLQKQYNIEFSEMVKISKESNYLDLFDVSDNRFLSSLDMESDIIGWFNDHHINPPKDKKDIINATYRSLANSYKIALDELEEITGNKYDYLYIVGGGAKNEYLNNLTKEFTKKTVLAYPIEATAIGNLLSQMEE